MSGNVCLFSKEKSLYQVAARRRTSGPVKGTARLRMEQLPIDGSKLVYEGEEAAGGLGGIYKIPSALRPPGLSIGQQELDFQEGSESLKILQFKKEKIGYQDISFFLLPST